MKTLDMGDPSGASLLRAAGRHAKAQQGLVSGTMGLLGLLGLLAAGTHVFIRHLLAVLLLVGTPMVRHAQRSWGGFFGSAHHHHQPEGAAGLYTTRERLLGTVHAVVYVVDGLPALDANHRANLPAEARVTAASRALLRRVQSWMAFWA